MPFTSQKGLAFLKGKGISTKSWFSRKFGSEGLERSRVMDDLGSCRPADKWEPKNVPELESAYFPNWPCISEGPRRVVPSLLKPLKQHCLMEISVMMEMFYLCCPIGTCGY